MGGCCSSRDGKQEVKSIWYEDFLQELPSMHGKRIIITGTTSGTGFVAARACAKKGAEVVLLNRSSERSEEAERLLKQEIPEAMIYSISCDLADFASVRAAKTKFDDLFPTGISGMFGGAPQLDILCCNAGVMAFPEKSTKDGFDIQMQTNHLSHFLLVKEFLPSLEKAASTKGEARIVNHSSGARHGGPLDAKYFQKDATDLGGDGTSACFERYHQTKLANVIFTYALESRLKAKGSNVKPVCVTPGIAATSLVTNLEDSGTSLGCMKCLFNMMGPLLIQSAEDGTMPLLLGIAGDKVESGDLITPSQGPWWRNPSEAYGPPKISRRPLPCPEKSYVCEDEPAQAVLWKESEKAIGEAFPMT